MRRSNEGMSVTRKPFLDRFTAGSLLAAALIMTAYQAHAQTAPADTQATPPAKSAKVAAAPKAQPVRAAQPAAPASQSVVINLIRLLVQEGVLTQDKANALIRQAEDEAAAAARGQAPVINQPSGAPKLAGGSTPATSQSVRVPYIPEIVRKQIRDEVKQEVLQEARAENWAAPDQFPDWVKSVRISGDFRLRYEWDIFDKRNSAFFPNFSSLNAGAPFDLNNAAGTSPPLLDTTQDRQRLRERFRLGIGSQIDDEWAVGLRLATGNTPNPVSTNTTLGNSLADDSFNLDRAFIRYQPTSWVTAWLGRFPDPWFTTDLVWDEDVNFDGVAVQLAPKINDQLKSFVTIGAFPIANTPFNFPDNTSNKASSRDVWLYAAQVGADWRPDPDYEVKVGLAYYYFDNIDGQLSAPCTVTTSADPCSTDDTRPGFLQQGNTLFALRNLVNTGQTNPPQFQYYGLASQFHELNLTARLDYAAYDPVHVILDTDFVTNLGFNRNAIAARNPVNNQGPSLNGSTPGPWDGGDNAFQARITFGYPTLRDRWDWNFNVGYKYIESDAVVDAFTDSDFHLGGTNAKGYYIGGGIGIAKDVDLSAHLFSAREVTGSPYSVDVVQVDLNGRF
jgi:Putative porin